MRLTHVHVEGCGRFGTPARIEGLGPGVNILSARNEAGKSTLFRAIRTCLFERHNTSKEEVEALATEGLSLPLVIKVGFEHAGKRYEIAKSFLRGKSASLTCDGVEIARAAAADEKLWEILGVSPKSAKSLDEASYGLLWVQQGRSFDVPQPSEAAKGQLNAVIEQEVGTLVGGERARQLINTLKAEIGGYETEQGRAKAGGPLHKAREAVADVRNQRIEVESRLSALDAKLDELARLRGDLKSAGDPATAQAMKDEHDEAERRLKDAEKTGEELKRLTAEERQAHSLVEAQDEKLKALRTRAAAIDDSRARLKALNATIAEIAQEMAAVSAALAKLGELRASAEAEDEALAAEERTLTRLADLTAKRAQRARLAERLALLEDLRTRATRNEAALRASPVDEPALARLVALETEEAKLRASLEAGAPRVSLAAAAGADLRIDGTPVSGQATRSVTDPLVITVGPDVTITVTPPQAASAAAAKALAGHREKLKALLAACGAADAAELRRLRAARVELEEEARELRARRAALAVQESAAAEIEQLQTAIGEIDAEARRSEADGQPLPPPAEIAQRRLAAAERRAALRASRSGLEAQAEAQRAAEARLLKSHATLTGQGEAIHAQLNADLAMLPDETRAAALEKAEAALVERREAHRVKAARLDGLRAQAPEESEIERLRMRVGRLKAAAAGRQEKLEQLRQDIARLEGEVQVAGGDGLGERAAALALDLDVALAEETRIAERVEVLKLLRATVDRCYAERREQLNAPLRRHLKPFLHDVFPKAEIALGENFAIDRLSRASPEGEDFGRLSLGTQEQVAVLVRLAMGAMVCERGAEVPVILDDALVFSDDARIEQMFDAINRAGRNQQVIVFTCRERSFTSLGGRQLRIV